MVMETRCDRIVDEFLVEGDNGVGLQKRGRGRSGREVMMGRACQVGVCGEVAVSLSVSLALSASLWAGVYLGPRSQCPR